MRHLCMVLTILVFILFILTCRTRGPVVRVEQGKAEGEKQAKAIAQQTPEAAAPKQANARAAQTLSVEQKPIEAAMDKQKDAERDRILVAEPKETPGDDQEPAQEGPDRPGRAAPLTVGAAKRRPAATDTEQKDEKPQKNQPPEVVKRLVEIMERKKAAEKKVASAEEELMQGIAGLIIEETMTKIGYDFYEYFFLLWEAPKGISVKDYNIFINERASPSWGSWVQVRVDERIIWNSVLRPRSVEIEDAAKQAVAATKQYLVDFEQYQFKTNDMVGTGI